MRTVELTWRRKRHLPIRAIRQLIAAGTTGLAALPPVAAAKVIASTAVVVAAVDYMTGPDIASSPFYLIPVSLAAWRFGGHAGGWTSLLCAALWLFADIASNEQYPGLWVEVWNSFMRFTTFILTTVLLTDIHARLNREQRLARTDGLTGALNKRGFHEAIGLMLAQAQRQQNKLMLVYIDLDGFKAANDKYGHAAGDEVLRSFARAAALEVASSDCFARIGGDEFILLLSGQTADPYEMAEALHARLSDALAAMPYGVTCSMGALIIRPEDAGGRKLFEMMADQLMYEVKRSGKNSLRVAHVTELAGEMLRALYPAEPDPGSFEELLARIDQIDRIDRAGMPERTARRA